MAVRRVVIVTGAGASRALGAAKLPMPLMPDWASSLREAIEREEPGAADVIGLSAKLPGDKFETRLGQFLAFESNLVLVERLAQLGAIRANERHPHFASWMGNAKRRTSAIVEVIRADLFANFGRQRIDAVAARSAYEELRRVLDVNGASSRIAFATTNYDHAIEVAFTALGAKIMDGFDRPPYATAVLDPLGLAERSLEDDAAVPVLHLHGAVGWYRQDDAAIRDLGTDLPYNPTLGTPALLLPDASKTVDSLTGAETLWSEFRQLLQLSTHVLVLGHSLNDRHLVGVLRDVDSPTAVVQYVPEKEWRQAALDRREARLKEWRAQLHSSLPGAHVVPGAFGPGGWIDRKAIQTWLAAKSPARLRSAKAGHPNLRGDPP